jgi:DNA-binding transcriptional regulator YiaG
MRGLVAVHSVGLAGVVITHAPNQGSPVGDEEMLTVVLVAAGLFCVLVLEVVALRWLRARIAARRRADDLALVHRTARIYRQMSEENGRNLQRNRIRGTRLSGFPGDADCALVSAMTTAAEVSTVGSRIRLMRKRAELSKRQLAKAAGVDERQLRGWENDEHEPTASSLRRLIPHIGGTLDFYLGPDGER